MVYFKSCLTWSFWNSCGFNPVYFCLCYAAGGTEVRVWSVLRLFSAPCKRGFTALSLRSFIIHSKEQGEQIPVLWMVYHSVSNPHCVWQEFFNSAQSQPASERQLSHMALVPVSGWCQEFVCSHHLQTHGSLGSRQLGSLLSLSSPAAPLSAVARIQLWSFCCQLCWLQQ